MIGIDEVGRGCWAGPLLVVAARTRTAPPAGLKDSKLLSKTARQKLFSLIHDSCDIGEGWVSPGEIDEFGLSAAMRLGVERALFAIKPVLREEVIIDGDIDYLEQILQTETRLKDFDLQSQAVIKADSKFPIVSAASVHAKVRRDDFMAQVAAKYPGYGFKNHAGYGTSEHLLALKTHGVCMIHRLSYKPVKLVYEATTSS